MSEPTRLGDRYRLGRRLGAGGFGEVFEATDQRTGDRVAVKRLLRLEPYALMLFKQEFRLLCDCAHPHLVGYHELISDGADWYVVMDYVDGVDLRTWVTEDTTEKQAPQTRTLAQAASGASDPTRMMLPESLATSSDSAVSAAGAPPLGERQVARLRTLLPQLESALTHLHARGLVHRDIKPSNILVDPQGRLVVLDFGLAFKHIDDGSPRPRDVVGTVRYMSPEQAAGATIGPASDWYSVGVMLYSLLSGAPPFVGEPSEVLAAKRAVPPPDPRAQRPQLPPDLCELTLALLDPDPERRPRGLGAAAAPAAQRALPFVGRAAELARLRGAWTRVEGSSQGRLVLIHGPSGIGKSALAHEFLAEFRRRPGALTLHGRCYERESLPFKALDGVVDALAAHLATLPPAASARLLPRYAGHLGDLFPVLARVPAMAAARLEPRATVEAHERRRRGFHALRELLVRIGEQRPLALFFDDLQWSDEDSLAALGELLAMPDPPPLLAVACCRAGSAEPTEPLAALHAALERSGVPTEVLAVGPLEEGDAVELARAALAERDARGETQLLRRAAAGHPLLLLELARAASVAGESRAPTVAELLDARIAALPANARALLECAAVAGRPRPIEILQRAAGLAEGTIDALATLRAERLVRTRAGETGEEIAPFHDQVAEAVLRQLTPERLRERHRRLAETIAVTGDPLAAAEALFRHRLGAGETAEALRWAEAAAERATASLAFERAAELYRSALELAEPARRGAVRLKLADALANAGRGPAAGEAYRAASSELSGADARYAMRRAAAQFLRSGHMDEGLATAHAALAAVGERWHKTALRAGLTMQARRLLRVRAEALPRGEPRLLTPRENERLDSLWELAQGLGGTDTVRGAELHGRHLALALRARDPYRAAKGLAWEAILTFAEGGKRQLARGWRLVELAAALATRVGNEHVRAWSQAAGAYGHWCEGRFAAAVAGCEAAADGYRECLDVAWELGSVLAWCWAPTLAAQGDISGLRRLCAEVEREFGGLGDLYTLVTLRTNAKPLLHFADDQPEAAVVEVEEAIASWSRQAWHLQHLFAHLTRAKAALYLGWPREALALLDEAKPRAHAALQDRLQIKRAFLVHLRGCAAAMLALEEPSMLAEVARAERALRAERLAWCDAHAEALAAAALMARGEWDAAAGRYRLAAASYDTLGMALHRAAARRRVAQATRDDAAITTADAELTARGVVAPAKLAAMLVPGPGVG